MKRPDKIKLEVVKPPSNLHFSNYLGRRGMSVYADEFTFRLNEGNVENHTLARLGSFVDATAGKRLTYERLTA